MRARIVDANWWDEKNQGNRVLTNNKGLMPKCYSCGAQYKMVTSDKTEFPFKAEHPKNSCPFKEKFYSKEDLDCLNQVKDKMAEMSAKRTTLKCSPS